ncbi:Os01g0687150, partial [Oryza sativa Japonica Group]
GARAGRGGARRGRPAAPNDAHTRDRAAAGTNRSVSLRLHICRRTRRRRRRTSARPGGEGAAAGTIRSVSLSLRLHLRRRSRRRRRQRLTVVISKARTAADARVGVLLQPPRASPRRATVPHAAARAAGGRGAWHLHRRRRLRHKTTASRTYLPVSTSAILISTQLAFIVFFACFIERQRLLNAMALLTISSHTSTPSPAAAPSRMRW